ncbi:MAG: translesion error-prone DNA polymerase V autoproteolytic subunit [Bifidobacterium subtile]|nr:translesion error-prone DNA polymerase V autoproteolytic subunit [Bifidobacterium subtile]MCI1257957.1 translesion error-prone DNA polymerase V autoproteolytic subunit [Bifidobacterium subtile]
MSTASLARTAASGRARYAVSIRPAHDQCAHAKSMCAHPPRTQSSFAQPSLTHCARAHRSAAVERRDRCTAVLVRSYAHRRPTRLPMAMESVHAGFPSPAQDDFAGGFSFDEQVTEHPCATYIVTVAGDSMQGAGIWDGDLLVVDRSLEARHGDVVVAMLGGELTVKRLWLHSGSPVLHAENPAYPDFHPEPLEDLTVWGVVTGSFHPQEGRRLI